MPQPENHVNNEILEYLNHFNKSRLIEVPCANPDESGRKRSDSEKARLINQTKEAREEQKQLHEKHVHEMKQLQESRDQFKSRVFGLVDESRGSYKKDLQENMVERNKYRDLISNRKDKERALLDIVALEKVDLAAL